ncbi:MAG: Putative enzyme structurally related to dihydroxyacetone/glyceraldehyde kinase [Thermocaproicibacter melissae]|uniref:DAK2 domain-containing protein n=1 Tax=Thermocaproicibacter melissae TaxID=2966552 RepID=UPI0024B04A8C|nr:DAK2 domain-containing protein [Thermocaproicibacter melissae]WBY63494.1 DAK2 domain-containing protein [Thermocaproicibacter melissae]
MINGTDLKTAIISGANNVLKYRTSINELNIFPVPDGDTGTNMSMTISSAVRELENNNSDSAGEIAKTAAGAMLRGARGNSGVILSILFRGFAKGLEGKNEVGGGDIVEALGIGVEAAYKAVMKPTEGTILTVARLACEAGRAALENGNDPCTVWQAVCNGAEEALKQTPEFLPVLKRAGVVDAGGKGLCCIFEGMLSYLRDGVVIQEDVSTEKVNIDSDEFFRNAAAEFDQEIHFTYCTEFIVGRNKECTKQPSELRAFLETIGDCVLVVDDDEIIKVHVHTENPGNALEAGLAYGQLLTVKIENMKEQHRKAAEENEEAQAKNSEEFQPVEPTEEVGFVAVAAGDGLKTLFTDLGCGQVVSGGQTMNPSTEMIAAAVRATPAKTVFVLPNNKNIILAVEQAIPLVTDRKLVLLPTKTIPQGLTALLAYDPESTVEENTVNMMEAASAVATGTVTYAARDSEFGGRKIRKDDTMGLVNGKLEIIDHNRDISKVCTKLVRQMVSRSTSFVTLIYGNNVTEEEATNVCNQIKAKIPSHIEVTLVNGGQPVYYYIVSVE